MQKILPGLIVLFSLISYTLSAQIHGTRQVPSTHYPDLAAVADSLNQYGVGPGGVTFEIAGNSVFNQDTLIFRASGRDDDRIIIRWDGVGSKPVLNFLASTAEKEAGITIMGGSYYRFEGLEIRNPDGMLEYGFHFTNASAEQGSHYNEVRNCVITLNKLNSRQTEGIRVAPSVVQTQLSGANTHNRFLDNDIKNATFAYYLDANTLTVGLMDVGNEVGASEKGKSVLSDLVLCGVYLRSQNGAKVYNLNIMNFERIGAGSTAPAGISTTSPNPSGSLDYSFEIYNNTIEHLHSSTTSIFGMYLNQRNAAHYVYNNIVRNIKASGGGTNTATGITTLALGSVFYIYNNMIFDVAAPASGLTNFQGASRGMDIRQYAQAHIYYNSVWLNYTASLLGHSSAAIIYNNATDPITIRNNIFVNQTELPVDGTGYAVAIYKNSNTLTNIQAETNHNIFYAGTPSERNMILYGHNNSAPLKAQTLADYKALAGSFDQESYTELLSFYQAGNLRVNPFETTLARGNAKKISTPISIETDIYGLLRDSDHPDIGAAVIQHPYPPSAQLEGPVDAQMNVHPNQVLLEWTYEPSLYFVDAAGFHVYMASTAEFDGISPHAWVAYVPGQLAYNYAIPQDLPEPNTKYYWQVVPAWRKDLGPFSPANQVWSFTTVDNTIVPSIHPIQLKVYPNPAVDFVKVEFDGEQEVSLWDLRGQRIRYFARVQGALDLDLRDVPAGIYLIRVQSGVEVYTHKISLIR